MPVAESDAARMFLVERKKKDGGDGDGRTGEMVMVVRRPWAPESSSQPAQRSAGARCNFAHGQWAFGGGSLAVGVNGGLGKTQALETQLWHPIMAPNYGGPMPPLPALSAPKQLPGPMGRSWWRCRRKTSRLLCRRRSLGPMFNDLAPSQRSSKPNLHRIISFGP